VTLITAIGTQTWPQATKTQIAAQLVSKISDHFH
jgi:hypothetical protein